ncbi:hypothetical protein [Nostoc sp. TCL26-01]|uniref:hypothetical protein n=1 Tax=Nostoc sp. TCL26-01 TaxID=2576904 RepID=UPI0015BAB5DF|nr:hypothetical protein [Nostoc sp. TCL26-01]QLE55451.1 hypothetical protein FD725_07930 [Nostoc sp. TCL26-01]
MNKQTQWLFEAPLTKQFCDPISGCNCSRCRSSTRTKEWEVIGANQYHLDLREEEWETSGNSCLTSLSIPVALSTPARDLRRQEARDIVVYLLSQGSFALKQKWSPLQFGSNCKILQPKPDTKIAIEPAIIDGVRFVNRINRKSNLLFNLDVRMIVLLYRLANLLRTKWGVTEIHHMGIGQGSGNAKDCHNTGRALDFAGVVGNYDGQPYTIDVLKDWGKQPVTMPDGTTQPNWPANFTQTTYRLNPTNNFLAYWIFWEVYTLGTREAADTSTVRNGNTVAQTTLGRTSKFIIHPDYPNPGLRRAHQNHIHMQIGPTGEEKNPP